jgi:hypothetical protein
VLIYYPFPLHFKQILAIVVYLIFLSETGGKSMEDIAQVFGDELATDRIREINVIKHKEKYDSIIVQI